MGGLALAIALAAAVCVVITVIICDTVLSVKKIQNNYTANMAIADIEIAKIKKEVTELKDILESTDVEKLSKIHSDVMALKIKTGMGSF